MKEVKSVVWDCDSFKSPRLDEINFGFLKEFWEDLKNNFFLKIFVDFHVHGRLVRGINNTFIVLSLRRIILSLFCILDLFFWWVSFTKCWQMD